MTDLKTNVQTSKFSYRIEPKPGGGFIATPSESGMPALEGTTREEVQKKIEAAVTEMIGQRLPAIFKLGNLNVRLNSNINISTRTSANAQAGTKTLNDSPTTQSPMLPSAAPIVPERSSSAVLWILVGLMVLAALLYFSYLHK